MKGNWNLNSLMKFLPNDMTDLAWQQYFSELKNEVKPSSQENMTSRNYIDVDGRIESTSGIIKFCKMDVILCVHQ